MTFRGQGLRSNQTCEVCGNRKRAKRSVLALPCPRCGRGMCVKHSVCVDGETICTVCLRAEPAEIQRAAVRSVV